MYLYGIVPSHSFYWDWIFFTFFRIFSYNLFFLLLSSPFPSFSFFLPSPSFFPPPHSSSTLLTAWSSSFLYLLHCFFSYFLQYFFSLFFFTPPFPPLLPPFFPPSILLDAVRVNQSNDLRRWVLTFDSHWPGTMASALAAWHLTCVPPRESWPAWRWAEVGGRRGGRVDCLAIGTVQRRDISIPSWWLWMSLSVFVLDVILYDWSWRFWSLFDHPRFSHKPSDFVQHFKRKVCFRRKKLTKNLLWPTL